MGSVDKYARRLARVEKQVFHLATKTRLDRSSIENGSIEVHDQYGDTTAIIGVQYDGTTSAAPVGGLPVPQPTMPMVTPVPGGLRIYWDGSFFDGSVSPMNFRRVTFHAVTDVDLFDPTDAAQIVGEVTIATGGESSPSLAEGVEHFVFAVAWSEAGKFSVESEPAFGTPIPTPSQEELDEAIALAEQAATAATEAQAASAAAAAQALEAAGQADNAGSAALEALTAAGVATSAADLANQAALEAAGIAATKGKVYYQATAPIGDYNSLWISTNGNKPFRWNGTSWVTVRDEAIVGASTAAAAATTAAEAATLAAQNANATATAAALAADAAGALATGAQQSASGKSTIRYSTALPGDAVNALGDTWFQISAIHGRVISQWRGLGGTSWVQQTLDGAIISNIDIGTATVGILSGLRVNAEELVIGALPLPDVLASKETPAGAQAKATAAQSAAVAAASTASTAQAEAARLAAIATASGDATSKAEAARAAAVSAAATDALNKANTARDAAIAAASTDAQTKATAAQQAAITAAGTASTASAEAARLAAIATASGDATSKASAAQAAAIAAAATDAQTRANAARDTAQTFATAQATAAREAAEASSAIVAQQKADAAYNAAAALAATAQAAADAAPTDAELATAAANAKAQAIAAAAIDASAKATAAREQAEAAAAIDAANKAGVAQAAAISAAATDAQSRATAAQAAAISAANTASAAQAEAARLAAISTASGDAASKAAAAQAAAIAAAATDASTKATNAANAAQAAAIAAAATDATTKANTAQSTAISTAAADATTKANNAKTAAEAAAATYASAQAEAARLAAIASASGTAQTKADAAQAAAVSTAAADALTKANTARDAAIANALTTYGETKTLVSGWRVTGKTTIAGGQIETDSILAGSIKAAAIETRHLATETLAAIDVRAETVAANVAKFGFVLTGQISVGTSYWNATEGFVVKSLTGATLVRFPVDGSNPTITANLIAESLTVKNNLNINGVDNSLTGRLLLATGVTRPQVAPSLTTFWDGYTVSRLDASLGPIYYGLAQHLGDPNAYVTVAASPGQRGFVAFNKETGTSVAIGSMSTATGFLQLLGGVTSVGGFYYVLGKMINPNHPAYGSWFVQKLNPDLSLVTQRLVGNYNAYPGRPVIGNNGSGPMIAYSDGSNSIVVQFPNVDTGDLPGRIYSDFAFNGASALTYIGEGNFDFGAARTVIGIENNATFVTTTSGARQDGFNFKTPGTLHGMMFDGGVFRSLNTERILSKHSPTTVEISLAGSYAWYDGVGTTRETEISPVATLAVPARQSFRIDTPPPPYNTDTSGNVDKANRVAIYLGVNGAARRLQSFLPNSGAAPWATTTWSATTVLTSGKTEPTANGFIGSTVSPGSIQSTTGDGGGMFVTLNGSGGGRVGPVGWTDQGHPIATPTSLKHVVARRLMTSTINFSNQTNWGFLPAGADRTALQRFITKGSASTRLIVRMHVSMDFQAGVAQLGLWGIWIGGNIYEVARYRYPVAPNRQNFAGTAEILNFPAGTYEINPVFYAAGASQFYLWVGDDTLTYEVQEVLA